MSSNDKFDQFMLHTILSVLLNPTGDVVSVGFTYHVEIKGALHSFRTILKIYAM